MTTVVKNWWEVDQQVDGLATSVEHQVQVQREAIPIIFVPGVMGSRLRRAGTNGTGNGRDGLPNLRWDPAAGFLYTHYSGCTPAHRKAMLIGGSFSSGYLEVDNATPVGDGFRGIMAEYREFLLQLRSWDWGAVGRAFVFPVHGFGYNWTDSNRESGRLLASRIDAIIDEARAQVGLCEKVILVTHSMGGLVARSACLLHGAQSKVLGVVHGVQPANGSGAAYWRIKAGFEGDWVTGRLTSRFLGSDGRHTTVLLGNGPGGLQLLPNKLYRTTRGAVPWLQVSGGSRDAPTLPRSNPYAEIYRVPAQVHEPAGTGASSNRYWGLVDPALLTPEAVGPPVGEGAGAAAATMAAPSLDDVAEAAAGPGAAWDRYLGFVDEAESFHDDLAGRQHPATWTFWGSGLNTAEQVRMFDESNWVRSDPYVTRGFRGFFRDAGGSSRQAVLQDPDGDGDGTVPTHSARMSGRLPAAPSDPANRGFDELSHQPAYEDGTARRWTVNAIFALAGRQFRARRG
jgi:pimeloyl-ACP methyl ester carboxylesterase